MAQQINMNDMNNEYGSSPQSSMNRYPQIRQKTGYPQGQGYYVDPQSGAVRSNPFETAMQPAESLSTYISKTYLWMFAGLLLTFFVALGMNLTGMTYRLLTTGGYAVLIAVTIAEFVCVITMSAAVRKRKRKPTSSAKCAKRFTTCLFTKMNLFSPMTTSSLSGKSRLKSKAR